MQLDYQNLYCIEINTLNSPCSNLIDMSFDISLTICLNVFITRVSLRNPIKRHIKRAET